MPGTILIVDDKPRNLDLLYQMLEKNEYEVRAATSGEMALKTAMLNPPDLFLLDINMPDMNGYEVCKQLKQNPRTADIPIIFISAADEVLDKVRAFASGGLDYVTKPFQLEEVMARISTHVTLYQRQKELEQIRAEEKRYLETLSKMKDDVISTASHDLKNPLSNVMMALGMLDQHGIVHDEKGQRYLRMIKRGSERMLTIITDLLDLAKLETGFALEKQRAPINELLAKHVEDFSFQAQDKQIAIEFVPLPEEICLLIDPQRISQVVCNLLSNAIKYSPPNTTIIVSTEKAIRSIIVSISDQGFGIPKEDIDHLFEKFHRVHTSDHMTQEGTGLGLCIVKTIIDQHGGSITVVSEPSVGSTFRFTLPLD